MEKNHGIKNERSRRWAGAIATALVLATGTAFAASGPERALAGIHIFDPGSEVTAKFGNPSRILVGGLAPGAFTPGSATANGAGGAAAAQTPGGYPGAPTGPDPRTGTGLLPGFPGVPTGGGAGGEFPGAPGTAGTPTAAVVVPPKPPVTLIYDRQNGGSLEFTISPDKRVIQIRETGYSGAYGTSRGLKLGMKYSDVNRLYGYPENTLIQGPIINTDYKDTLHCGFQFLDQRLVGIIVVSPD